MAAPLSFKPDLLFGTRVTVEQVEEGNELAPKFDASGLIPCVTTDFHSGEVLMVAVMNYEALTKTIETGQAYYYSRSRQTLWHKGATSKTASGCELKFLVALVAMLATVPAFIAACLSVPNERRALPSSSPKTKKYLIRRPFTAMRQTQRSCRSGQNIPEDFTVHIGESSLNTVVIIGQSLVIDAQQMHHSSVVVVPVDRLVLSLPTKLIGGSVSDTVL